ncbi:histidine phosphatase family protein [Microscilla marina]|uniref:phosphoglycerate mutase (2,3-diphosphoglycerate-dependent) n=1 Tax=Microscilla marina ATCC 23134 TaxID=313606 RepID=A1ZMA3_MICM2|nr:histidine phosphatase family protein [Microscilla marina]EAY28635.1 phosphoglycerate mutase, putative [Microscilla marina ATCC 23134]
MKTKKIYLIRHGQTEYNLQGIVQGSGVDSDLNATGQRQAALFFDMYKSVKFDKIYTSKLKRSIQSVQRFIDAGIPVEHYSGLNEINWGSREGRKISEEDDAYYHELVRKWGEGEVDLPIEGGESPVMLQERQKPVLDKILSREEEKTVLICMHGRAMRAFLALMLNYHLKDMDKFEHTNLCLYELNYTGNMFTVDRYCDITHLKPMEEQ